MANENKFRQLKKIVVILHLQPNEKWFAERKRICVILQAVNLDTSPYNYCRNNGNDCLLVLCVAARRGQEECKGREGGKNVFCVHIDGSVCVDTLVNR